MIPNEPDIDDLIAIVRANGYVVATKEAIDQTMGMTVAQARAQGRAEGSRAGLERAAEIVELIPMLTGEQAHKIAERIRNEGDR